MGCGDAKIARTSGEFSVLVTAVSLRDRLTDRKIHSFDLVPSCDRVVAANIANVNRVR